MRIQSVVRMAALDNQTERSANGIRGGIIPKGIAFIC